MNKKKREIFCIAAAIFIFIGASIWVVQILTEYQKGEKAYENIAKLAQHSKGENNQKDTNKTDLDTSDVEIDFSYLSTVNSDIIGWIRSPNGEIDYPILKGKDNEEYLNLLPDKVKNTSGSIFMETLCRSDFSDSHTILYGHNRRDLSMFGSLKKYVTNEGYYEENPYFTLYTPEGTYFYEVFSYYEAQVTDSVYQVGFIPNEEFSDFILEMKNKSYHKLEIAVLKEDKIVTLSTCSGEGKRFVVHGKRV